MDSLEKREVFIAYLFLFRMFGLMHNHIICGNFNIYFITFSVLMVDHLLFKSLQSYTH